MLALAALPAVTAGVVSRAGNTAQTYTVSFPPASTLQVDPAVFAEIPLRQVDQIVWLEFAVGDILVVTNNDLFSHVL